MFEVKSLNNQQDPCNVIYKINEKFIYNEGDKIFVKTDFLIQFLNESLEKPFILYTGVVIFHLVYFYQTIIYFIY